MKTSLDQLTINFQLAPYVSKKGKSKLIICYLYLHFWMYKYKPLTFSTGVKVHPDFWQQKEQKAVGAFNFVNTMLDELRKTINETYIEMQKNKDGKVYINDGIVGKIKSRWDKLNYIDISENIYQRQTKADPFNKYDFRSDVIDPANTTWADYIKITANKRNVKDKSDYNALVKELNEYHEKNKIPHVYISEISHKYFMAFLSYLKDNKDWTVSYFGKFVKNIKVFYNHAQQVDKLNLPLITFKESDILYKVNSKDSKDVSLSSRQLQKFIDIEFAPNEKELEIARDLFIVGGLTGGLRISDLKRLQNIQTGIIDGKKIRYIESWSEKTNQYEKLPLYDIADSILKKYNDQLPKMNDSTLNDNLKIISQRAGFNHKITTVKTDLKTGELNKNTVEMWTLIGTSTMRKTFCTIMFREKKLDATTIMAFSGHKHIATFEAYIADSGDSVQFEEHARMIMKDKSFSKPKKAPKLKAVS